VVRAFAFSRLRVCNSRFLQRTLWNFCHGFAGTKVSSQSRAAHFCCLGFGITRATLNCHPMIVKGNRNLMTRQGDSGDFHRGAHSLCSFAGETLTRQMCGALAVQQSFVRVEKAEHPRNRPEGRERTLGVALVDASDHASIVRLCTGVCVSG